MIYFFSEIEFELDHQKAYCLWIRACANRYNKCVGEIRYIFCDDDYLLRMNKNYLEHDTLTDIISFDDSEGATLNGDIFISVERVIENSKQYRVPFAEELARVMIHGVLHFIGFGDKDEKEAAEMRWNENLCLESIHDYVPRGT